MSNADQLAKLNQRIKNLEERHDMLQKLFKSFVIYVYRLTHSTPPHPAFTTEEILDGRDHQQHRSHRA